MKQRRVPVGTLGVILYPFRWEAAGGGQKGVGGCMNTRKRNVSRFAGSSFTIAVRRRDANFICQMRDWKRRVTLA